jgi:SAM-dependent methyltransferase
MTPLAQVQATVGTHAPVQVVAPGRAPASAQAPAPIEPLRSWPDGRYADELVVVTAGRPGEPGVGAPAGPASGAGSSPASGAGSSPAGGAGSPAAGNLVVWRRPDGRIAVRHRPRAGYPDDELASPLAAALAPLTDDHEVFKRAFTGIVLTSQPRAEQAWDQFYRNSLARIRCREAPGYTVIYRHAASLLAGPRVADLGCGFGLFALYLASRGISVTACDIEPGAAGLLRRAARAAASQGAGSLDVLACDARAVPIPAGSVDGVVLLHVLEHVDGAAAACLLREAVRLARIRVVVAVPYEEQPNPLFGHVRSINRQQLSELGAATGWRYQVHEQHGGWLVLDRPFTPLRRPPPGAAELTTRTRQPAQKAPSWLATYTASLRRPTSSLRMMLATWNLAVVSAMNKVRPISRLDKPRASSPRTSTSRAVSALESRSVTAVRPRTIADELRGSKAFSPWCTARIARSSSEVSTSFTT